MGPKKTIVIACGGTGGHLTPGMAVGECLKETIPNTDVFYLFSGKEIEVKFRNNFHIDNFYVLQLKGNKMIEIPLLVLQTVSLFKKIKPEIVLGFGSISGFVSVLCAKMLGIPSFLFEQNTIMGKANRLSSLFAKKVFLSFPLVKKTKNKKFIVLGNPIRKSIKFFKEKDVSDIKRELGLDLDKTTFLIMGGSQGAYSLNRFMLNNADKFLKEFHSFQVIHITGKHLLDDLKNKYNSLRIKNYVVDFYKDMGKFYRVSDIAISRAGATSIFELAYFGIPSIFVPYPYASDNHQYFNALYIKSNGAGFMIEEKDFNFENVAKIISGFFKDAGKMKDISVRFNNLLKFPECDKLADLFEGIL